MEGTHFHWLKQSCNKENAIGYCHHNMHKGYLSVAEARRHRCMEKQCRYFSKYEDRKYWMKKTVIKIIKKYKKYTDGYILLNNRLLQKEQYDVDILYSMFVNEWKQTGKIPTLEFRTDLYDLIEKMNLWNYKNED